MAEWPSDDAFVRTLAMSVVLWTLYRYWMLTVVVSLEDVSSALWILLFATSNRVQLTSLGTWRLRTRAYQASTLYLLIFPLRHLLFFYFSLSFIGFTYSLLLSIPSLSTRIVPLRFQAGGSRKRPNMCLVCFVCVICIP